MGSVPIHMPKLIAVSAIVEVLGFIAMLLASDWDNNWLFLLAGVIFYLIMYARYRNKGARHKYETETKNKISNMKQVDTFIKKRKGLKNHQIEGANNRTISSGTATSNFLNSLKDNIKVGK